MAGPAVGRLRTGRPGETKAQATLVDALPGATADAGSIPAASIGSGRKSHDFRPRVVSDSACEPRPHATAHVGRGGGCCVRPGSAPEGTSLRDALEPWR